MPSAVLTGSNSFWSLLLVIFLRYAVIALVAWIIFYVVKKEAWKFRRIQQKFPLPNDYAREILYSISTTLIFALVGYTVFLSPFAKYTQVYHDIEQRGVAYFLASIVMMLLLHDTYFYWTHRLMHRKAVFRIVHRVHHLSTNPSPWAAMAFHPIEAVIEAGVIVLIALLFPAHPLGLAIFLLFMMIYNVYGHLGYELYPKGFSRSMIGKWINTSVNHNMHHQQINGNYGLYFLFWDRIMGTIQPTYDAKFDEVSSRRHVTSSKETA